jgi:hypothetical protein
MQSIDTAGFVTKNLGLAATMLSSSAWWPLPSNGLYILGSVFSPVNRTHL